ncbi:MAG: MGDG synthase family glycosyltransferase [Acidimicrobiales bacterium]
MTVRRALFLSGKLGAGHDTLAEACATALVSYGVESKIVDCMPMLGGGPSAVGNWVFRRLLSLTPVYDGFHFSQLRANGTVGRLMDRTAVKVMLPKLAEEVDRFRPDLLVSVFATGASAAVHLKEDRPDLATVVFMTDSFAYGMWAHEGTDLFLVTSALAAASIRSYYPDARVAVVEAPVRAGFYDAPSQADARTSLGVPLDARCILIMSGAWGIGPLDEVARALASEGWWVLAVSGTNARLGARLATVARQYPSVIPFGFSDRIPELMSASDVVLTSSGDTCREARAIGRRLLLLDVVPGHGRENLMHELELGDAAVCLPTPASVVGNVRRLLTERQWVPPSAATGWGEDFVDELVAAGIELRRD